jgi:cobalamin biosynthesis protein CbiG
LRANFRPFKPGTQHRLVMRTGITIRVFAPITNSNSHKKGQTLWA